MITLSVPLLLFIVFITIGFSIALAIYVTTNKCNHEYEIYDRITEHPGNKDTILKLHTSIDVRSVESL